MGMIIVSSQSGDVKLFPDSYVSKKFLCYRNDETRYSTSALLQCTRWQDLPLRLQRIAYRDYQYKQYINWCFESLSSPTEIRSIATFINPHEQYDDVKISISRKKLFDNIGFIFFVKRLYKTLPLECIAHIKSYLPLNNLLDLYICHFTHKYEWDFLDESTPLALSHNRLIVRGKKNNLYKIDVTALAGDTNSIRRAIWLSGSRIPVTSICVNSKYIAYTSAQQINSVYTQHFALKGFSPKNAAGPAIQFQNEEHVSPLIALYKKYVAICGIEGNFRKVYVLDIRSGYRLQAYTFPFALTQLTAYHHNFVALDRKGRVYFFKYNELPYSDAYLNNYFISAVFPLKSLLFATLEGTFLLKSSISKLQKPHKFNEVQDNIVAATNYHILTPNDFIVCTPHTFGLFVYTPQLYNSYIFQEFNFKHTIKQAFAYKDSFYLFCERSTFSDCSSKNRVVAFKPKLSFNVFVQRLPLSLMSLLDLIDE